MKTKYLCVFLLFTISCGYVLAQSSSELIDITKTFPQENSEASVKKFLSEYYENKSKSIYKSSDQYNDMTYNIFDYMYKNNLKDFIITFILVFDTYYPEKGYSLEDQRFTNPLKTALENKDYTLAKKIISVEPELVNSSSYSSPFSYGFSPIVYAINDNNLQFVEYYLSLVKDINLLVPETYKDGPHSIFFDGLINWSTSKEMDELLIKKGLRTFIDNLNVDTYITDNNVNFRTEPSINAKVIKKLHINQSVTILGYTYKEYTYGEYTGRWIKIKTDNEIGWVLESFVYIYEQ